jgi:hypothetical protein
MEFKRLYEYSVRFFSLRLSETRFIKFEQYFLKFQNEYNEKDLFLSLELQCKAVKRLAEKLEHVTILKKGDIDIISDGEDDL